MRKRIVDLLSAVLFVIMWLLIIAICYREKPEPIQETVSETTEEAKEATTYLVETYEVREAPQKIVDVPLDAPTQHWLYDLCNEKGVDFYIALAMIEVESCYNSEAVNDNGTCIGYMQVNPEYHSMGMDVSAPLSNLLAGVSLMQRLLEHSGNDYTWALNAYNGGGAYADSIGGETGYSIYIQERAIEIGGN